jgi:hypothetical protein
MTAPHSSPTAARGLPLHRLPGRRAPELPPACAPTPSHTAAQIIAMATASVLDRELRSRCHPDLLNRPSRRANVDRPVFVDLKNLDQ